MRSNQSIWVVVMKMTKSEEKYFDVAYKVHIKENE
jgi:hypothetical protein